MNVTATVDNRRTGKIARLPHDLRLQVNGWLLDGVASREIIKRLVDAGVDGVNEVNITNWYQGGFQEWLSNQDKISALQTRREAALEMVKELKRDGTVTLADANELTLAAMVNEALEDFDPELLKQLMAEEPKQFFQLAMAINRQSNEQRKREAVELDYQKYRDTVEAAKKEIQDAMDKAEKKGGITKETRDKIDAATKLL